MSSMTAMTAKISHRDLKGFTPLMIKYQDLRLSLFQLFKYTLQYNNIFIIFYLGI